MAAPCFFAGSRQRLCPFAQHEFLLSKRRAKKLERIPPFAGTGQSVY
jgi:hypothetical protein